MKNLLMCCLVLFVSFGLTACDDSNEVDTDEDKVVEEVKEPEVKKEEPKEDKKEVKESEVKKEEPKEEKVVDNFSQDELNYYLTTNLSDSEYRDYFDSIILIPGSEVKTYREIEFDAHILIVETYRDYKTRCEVLLASGDFNDGYFTGPYIKTRDMRYVDLNGAQEGSNVRIRATIDGYDMDRAYLKITVKEVSVR